jgi:asparagine synthase (glutamine-hydrolysing)
MMPRRLADRPKASFPTPVARWLRDEWAADVRGVLQTSPFLRAVCQPAALGQLADNPAAAGMWLWPLLNLAFWGDSFV